jgi:hypothetical protein
MDFWVQVGRYCVASLNHIYFAIAAVEGSWDTGFNRICSEGTLCRVLFTPQERKYC